ncbi:aminotransferase class I/II-fold pyridoxal phosphate-dependent enzyme [Streptomyces sp. NBC_00151]|jgi:histidinol-phosphate aminotransferase|uniref:aminotransferase class I/II-fold pyridoxal phosphate-dependent enzyme n=1 Tax=Streptomyces sp. NBC_00151 TaxID=2975669 RepID=UPI002DDC8F82|nr:aminotransferase class I/II-fold pyridoxal phosphate-dependent enzyme [Streptomyces sp. NBC_00151]WRZ37331.1 aminotransferase class I/II-fold pyridoxal phosphate-dependent enzyme [Streptomyces sp. NBC_00151]
MQTLLHSQGGDLRSLPAGLYLDLGTCVNRYGPPPSVETALRGIDPKQILAHPYGSEEAFIEAYADFMGADPHNLIPGRGITEFIRVLGQLLPTDQVAVITPDYTDTIRWFPTHLDPPPGTTETVHTRLERVALALRTHPYVFLSNPNNPLGLYLHRDDLIALARDNPQSVLIVDEAYIEFVPEHRELSMVRSGLPNVVVLRSPNKLFGIAGTRTGALWTLNEDIARRVTERKLNWTLSHIDSVLATAALADTTWVEHTREALLRDSAELEKILTERFDGVVSGVPIHYRFVATDDALEAQRYFLDHGVVVRAFDGTQPGRVSGLRITTPTSIELAELRSSLPVL